MDAYAVFSASACSAQPGWLQVHSCELCILCSCRHDDLGRIGGPGEHLAEELSRIGRPGFDHSTQFDPSLTHSLFVPLVRAIKHVAMDKSTKELLHLGHPRYSRNQKIGPRTLIFADSVSFQRSQITNPQKRLPTFLRLDQHRSMLGSDPSW
jgi:hypothetical protein